MTRRATTTHRAAYVIGIVMSLEGSAAWAQASESCADANQQAEQLKDRCYALAGTPGMSTEALADMQETCVVEALEPLLHRCDTPWIRFSLGGAEANRGRWVRGWTLMDASRRTPDPLVEEAVRQGNALERARAHVVLVAPRSEGAAASLEVNGERIGALPLAAPVAVEPDLVRVRVTRAGCRPWERAGTFAGGDEMRERVVCEPLVVPSALRPPVVGSSRRLVGWALVGTGAALGVAASVFWGLSYDMAAGLTGYCGRPGAMADGACVAAQSMAYDAAGGPRVAPVEALCDGPRSGDLDSLCGRNRFQGATAIGLGTAGAVALVTGIVLVVTAPRAGAVVRGPSAWLRPDGGGVTLQGNF